MPGDKDNRNMEHLEESIGVGDHVDLLDDELKNNESDNSLSDILSYIDASASIFKFPLGTKVRNRHNEDGYVEMIGIDVKGVSYLVNLPECNRQWYNESEIKTVNMGRTDQDTVQPDRNEIRTDIPDPKQKQPNEMRPETPIETG